MKFPVEVIELGSDSLRRTFYVEGLDEDEVARLMYDKFYEDIRGCTVAVKYVKHRVYIVEVEPMVDKLDIFKGNVN